MERHHDAVDDALPRTDVDQILSAWSLVLDQLEASDVEALSDRVDWAAKYRLFQALKRRKGEVTDAMRERLDMDYHDIVNGSLYPSMLRRGVMRQLATPQQVEHAVSEPPADTRAALRGAFVAKALSTQCRFSCDANAVGCRTPFEYQANADVQHLMVWRLVGEARVAAGAGSALDALSGEQAGELQAFAGLHGLDEHVLESVNGGLSLSLGQIGLLGDLRNEIRLVVCHKASFFSAAQNPSPVATLRSAPSTERQLLGIGEYVDQLRA